MNPNVTNLNRSAADAKHSKGTMVTRPPIASIHISVTSLSPPIDPERKRNTAAIGQTNEVSTNNPTIDGTAKLFRIKPYNPKLTAKITDTTGKDLPKGFQTAEFVLDHGTLASES